MEHLDITPSIDLYNQVRGGFVGQGKTINGWCISNGVTRQAAEAALKGMYSGPKAKALKAELVKASGIVISSLNDSVTHSSAKQPATTGAVEFFYWGC